MPAIEYKLFFNGEPATREQLDRVEEITVEQEADMAWEATLIIPICTDSNGNWSGEDEPFLQTFTRVRIEVKNGDSPFAPLIDGPIVGYDTKTSSEPGQSSITVMVRDDSVFLHQEETISRFDGLTDSEIASTVYGEVSQIATTDIEDTPAPSSSLETSVVQRGTQMQLLRLLAQRHHMHAYVLPGETAGASIGAFRKYPTQKDGLPDLILLGPDRNMLTFNAKANETAPATVRGSSLSLADKVVTERTSSFRNLELLGAEAGLENESNAGTRVLPPQQEDAVDVESAVQAEADRLAFSFEATGSVMGDCYTGILSPYRVVSVVGVNGRLSGDYVISKVTHSLTRNQYSQSFTLLRNARSSGAGTAATNAAEAIF